MEVAGELTSDGLWEGRVTLQGDVVVPPGRTLRVRAGTELFFDQNPRWSCAVFRSAREGYPIEASSRESCDLVVLGRLEIEGSAERPVRVGRPEERWGGVVLLGRAEARVAHARICGSGAGQEALFQCFDDARLELRSCALSDAAVGALAWGLSSVRAQESSVEDVGCAFLGREGSTTDLFRATIRRAERGAWTQHWALARLEDCRVEDCSVFGAGAFDRSRLSVAGGSIRSCGQGLLGATEAEVSAVGVELRGNGVGVQGIESARLRVKDCGLGEGGAVSRDGARVAVTGRTA